MVNLRLLAIKAIDSTLIKAKFTENLSSSINTSSIIITSNSPGVPNAGVIKISVSGPVISIKTQPLTPNASYYIEFISTDTSDFKSINGSFVLEDGVTNKPLILGAEEPDNSTREALLSYLDNNIYNLDTGTIVRDIINSQAYPLSRALYDIRQVKSDNYIQSTIIDERKIRGKGPFDRLNEEGAFEILRVGRTITNATLSKSLSFNSFPRNPVTLQAISTQEELVAGTGFNGLILTVSRGPITKVDSIVIEYSSGDSQEYDIETFGYQILDTRYDPKFSSVLFTLEEDQIMLSSQAIEDGFLPPGADDVVIINYQFKNKGIIVDKDTVEVSQVLDIIREVTPPIVNEFSFDYAPIVDINNNIIAFDGVTFLDPLANPPFSDTHPAFTKELPFRLDGLPRNPGEYCIDYEFGRVFIYGEDSNDGTGNYPPTATYKYRNSFVSRLDYTYDSDFVEVTASPLRDLVGEEVVINFDYEQALIDNVDFKAQIHKEVLDERIENRLLTSNSIRVENIPITNTFRIFNETSGEIYPITRSNDDTIFFVSTNPPTILNIERERANFTLILNELLLINSNFTNTLGNKIFKLLLNNNNIISATDDVIGSKFNSSVQFSNTNIFEIERYFDGQIQTVTQNTDKLEVGQFQIDYQNGIIYIAVENDQDADLGTVTYKNSKINPNNPHVLSVSEIYNSISPIQGINKRVPLTSFNEGEILPSIFDLSDERFLDNDITDPYQVLSGQITVQDNIKDVRGIYDVYDLNNNIELTNFADGSEISSNVITLSSDGVEKQELSTIQSGLIVSVVFISPGAEIVSVESIIRTGDGVELFDDSGSFSGYDITLSGTNSPTVGDTVFVRYHVQLNGAATPVIDYNRGDYFINYTYLADEILISYEYGDNVLDFREFDTLEEGDEYFVSYKFGALRDALLKNFGSLVNVPILNTFDTTLNRERYRDALKGALQSFTKGPTTEAMKLLVSSITHIEPEIIEAAFNVWSLGNSYLYPDDINYTGDDLQLVSGKFDNGVLVENTDETITIPVSSNFRLEDGTLEMWVIPKWDGIDNDATLTFQIYKDNEILSASNIYIGASSFHPTLDSDNKFALNKNNTPSPIGLPSAIYTQTGVFIFYNPDEKMWKFYAKDSLTSVDGYVYSGTIDTSGEFYNVNFIPGLGEINDIKRTFNNQIQFEFNIDGYDVLSPDGYIDGYSVTDGYYPSDGYVPGYSFDGIQFMSDDEHYLFDFGKTESTNRFSLYKDGKGYLNFRIFDNGRFNRKTQNKVSADISDWLSGEKHQIGLSWKINSQERRDEMHLFIDGFEVSNILKYGGRPIAATIDRFRTVKPEIIAGVVPLPTITSNDLHIVNGSSVVTSDSVDFSDSDIVAGHTIELLEGFGTFTISGVAGNSLILSGPMITTLDDVKYSINPYSSVVSTQLDFYKNIAVSIIDNSTQEETEIPGLRATVPGYSISKNGLNQNILTLLGNANAGDQIAIRSLGLNFRRCREKYYVWGNISNIIRTHLPPPINLNEVKIVPVLLPLTSVGPSNSTLLAGRFYSTLTATQPSNSAQGRSLEIRITSSNVNFSNPPIVKINGTTEAGPILETFTFTSATTQFSSQKFKTITSVNVEATPSSVSKNSIAVEIKERYTITYSEGNSIFPVIRFGVRLQSGTTLEGDGSSQVSDSDGLFLESMVGGYIVIETPGSVAGTYLIESRIDDNTITISPDPAVAFTGGQYSIYNISVGRSGFQNGKFIFETAGEASTPFLLKEGVYEFDYAAYLEIPFDPISDYLAYIGSDINGNKQANVIIDELRSLSIQLTDVRVGETLADNEESITTDFTSLNPFEANSETLALIHFDSFPLENEADFWVTADREFLQSSSSVNDNFDKALAILNRPFIKDNAGLLTTNSEGSIEFWVSPKFDTYNDPEIRFYFDATSALIENSDSLSSVSVKTSLTATEILSVRLQTDIENKGIDYFEGGELADDFRTVRLGRALPSQNTPVKISYIRRGTSGDRISIYKDVSGFLNFNVSASGNDYQVRRPIFWARDSWHRVMATFKFNRIDNLDQIRLFVDGEEFGVIRFGQGLLFGQGFLFGQGLAGLDNSVLISDINFRDTINEIFIGSDYLNVNLAKARIDNLRLSNISRIPTLVSGQAKDINYNTNLDTVLPVVEDVFTTYLMNFDTIKFKTDDLAIIRDAVFGIFNFTLKVIDSFDLVVNDAKVTQILEELVKILKPAHSKIAIEYIQ